MDATPGGENFAHAGMFDHDPVVGSRDDYRWFDQCFPLPDGYAISPAGIHRNAQLASVLEPVVEFPGKATRSGDCSYEQRFAYFLAAGVNSGEAFRALGERLAAAKARGDGQPVMYDLAFRAQVESKRQRDGGRTNQGIIAMLFPLIAAQVFYLAEPPHPGNIDQSFEHVATALRATHPQDVHAIWAMTKLALTISGYAVSERGGSGLTVDPAGVDAPTVYDFYRLRLRGIDSALTHEPEFEPFVNNFEVARTLVAEVLKPQGKIPRGGGFPDVVAAACRRVHSSLPDSYTAAQIADDTVIALYVLFSHFPHAKILF